MDTCIAAPYSRFVDTRSSDDFVVLRTIARYPGVSCRLPEPHDLEALRVTHEGLVDRAHAWLARALGGEVHISEHPGIHLPLLKRICSEHLWGATLFHALHGEAAQYYRGPAALDLDRGLMRPPAGTILTTRRPIAAVLYTLAWLGWCEGLGPIDSRS